MRDRVAAIDVRKDVVRVAVRVPGAGRGSGKTGVPEFRTVYGVLGEMGRELRRRGVTHVVMEASGVRPGPACGERAEVMAARRVETPSLRQMAWVWGLDRVR